MRPDQLRHTNEGLKSRLKRRSGKNFRIVPHSFAPAAVKLDIQFIRCRTGDERYPASRLSGVRKLESFHTPGIGMLAAWSGEQHSFWYPPHGNEFGRLLHVADFGTADAFP
jgi:hypothetical protein